MWKKKIFTIPNILSLFRIILAVIFLDISVKFGIAEKRSTLLIILVISGITDFLDGQIARRFDMVSDLGKILDPIADKLTQGVLLISFLYQYKMAKYVLVLFLIKETYMGVMGLKTIATTGKNEGAMWYGKVSTAFFYAAMVILFLFSQISVLAAECLICACGIFFLMSLIMYNRYYKQMQGTISGKEQINES